MSKAKINRRGAFLDIVAEKGRTFYEPIHCQYYDSGNTLQDFSWTNYSGATMQVRMKPTTTLTELVFSTDDGTIELDDEGMLVLYQDAETMDGIRAGQYEYDIYVLGTEDIYAKRSLFYGNFIVETKITT